MNILNRERAIFAVQTFTSFLTIAKETNKQHLKEMEGHREKALNLLEKLISNKQDLLATVFPLNLLIESMNQFLKAPYPIFATDSTENLVKGEIVAFEHYLNQELKVQHLTIQQEAPLFNESLSLWEQVGVSLTAQEGASELAALIEKLNRFLPKEEQYPQPDALND